MGSLQTQLKHLKVKVARVSAKAVIHLPEVETQAILSQQPGGENPFRFQVPCGFYIRK